VIKAPPARRRGTLLHTQTRRRHRRREPWNQIPTQINHRKYESSSTV
jgi:hypothetical protein